MLRSECTLLGAAKGSEAGGEHAPRPPSDMTRTRHAGQHTKLEDHIPRRSSLDPLVHAARVIRAWSPYPRPLLPPRLVRPFTRAPIHPGDPLPSFMWRLPRPDAFVKRVKSACGSLSPSGQSADSGGTDPAGRCCSETPISTASAVLQCRGRPRDRPTQSRASWDSRQRCSGEGTRSSGD